MSEPVPAHVLSFQPMGPGRMPMQLLRGVVIEATRHSQTIVSGASVSVSASVSAGDHGVSAAVAPITSRVVHQHEIWLRQADGQELAVTLDTNTVQLRAGQPVSMLGRQHRGAFQCFMVINETTGMVFQTIPAAFWGLCGLMGQLYGVLCLLPLALSFPFVLFFGGWSKFALCLAAAILLFVPSWLRAKHYAAGVIAYVQAQPQTQRAAA